MSYLFSNDVNTTLAAAVDTTQTVISVASTANLPTLGAGDVLPITLSDAATHTKYEVCYCTSISGADLTVLRGMEGTSGQSWLVNDLCYDAHTAATTASFDGGWGTDTGAANAYVVTLPMTLTAYQLGQTVRFKAVNPNTGASTVNVNGLGVINIVGGNNTALQGGEISSTGDGMTVLVYDGTNFRMIVSPGALQIAPAAASNQAVQQGQSFAGATLVNGLLLGTPRAANTLYTNTSGRWMFVYIDSYNGTGTSINVLVVTPSGGSAIKFYSSASTTSTDNLILCGMVPPSGTYELEANTGSVTSILTWNEVS